MSRPLLSLVMTLALAGIAGAERPSPLKPQGKNLDVPEGWVVRLDKPDANVVIGSDKEKAGIYFVNMTPGWHVTTGPSAIFYHPENVAKGETRIKAVTHLFEPKGRHREAFGLLFGGASLGNDDQRYDYFVIRNSGEFLIKRRNGKETSVIRDWTRSEAILPWEKGMESAKNTLVIQAAKDDATFLINGQTVAVVPRKELQLDGIVGLRVNHHVDLHVEDLSIRGLD